MVFRWSGLNSHDERTTAAEALAKQLTTQMAEVPDGLHFVIAHSHGGTVAMYAARLLSSEHRGRLRGLVTLGTPFLRVWSRDVHQTLSRLSNCVFAGTLSSAALSFWFSMRGNTQLSELCIVNFVIGCLAVRGRSESFQAAR